MNGFGGRDNACRHVYHAIRQYSIRHARPGGLDGIQRVQDSMRGIIPSKTTIMIPKGEEKRRGPQDEKAEKVVVAKDEEQHITAQRHDVKRRLQELQSLDAHRYPRITREENAMSCEKFREQYQFLKNGQVYHDSVTLRGRVYSIRKHGSRLLFIDLVQDGSKVQAVLVSSRMDVDAHAFTQTYRTLKRGDIISISGKPKRQEKGELSIDASSLPTLLTPALATLPISLNDPTTLVKNRHADLLLHPYAFDALKLRSHLVQQIRNYLLNHDFLEVQTPILARSAGGAVARPFTTTSSEFPEKPLSLRIAPELWLKRLLLGGFDRVFELGPVFRNEGIDATHNPEFYTCEFYEAFASLDDLINKTENLMTRLIETVNTLSSTKLKSIPPISADHIPTSKPWPRLEFIPTLEKALGQSLPLLTSPDAFQSLLAIFADRNLPLPSTPTLPRLLDRLCGAYIEPLTTTQPAFITQHPSILAPLSKSFTCPQTGQLISARAELFIAGREIANMYEEENDPMEQRRKLVEQRLYIDGVEGEVTGEVDEDYLRALEWGLPPTGGWGLGVERLCMVLGGVERIAGVCSFGTLRSVVGLGKM